MCGISLDVNLLLLSRGEGEENHQSSDSGKIQSMVMNRVSNGFNNHSGNTGDGSPRNDEPLFFSRGEGWG